jgi:phosphoglucomutase
MHASSMKKKALPTNAALQAADLLDTVATNVRLLVTSSASPVNVDSVTQLAEGGQWVEMVDRFWRTLAFGTGGLRGRTIGRVVTAAEQGKAKPGERPDVPCVGTNAMNYFNISRAAQGLAAYCHDWFRKKKLKGRPMIVVAHDTRHYSREFAELVAKVAVELGCDAGLFEGPRSTPELSFAVRYTGATAGVVITASHNPPHDNGFKCYFADGAQVVEPHASAIVTKVNALVSDAYQAVPKSKQGKLIKLGKEIDNAYMDRLETLVLDRPMVKAANRLKVVFTPIHGTGGVISKPMLKRLGFRFTTVPEQDKFDGAFPTVKSPNPENAEALAMGIALAKKEHADVVIATDPDSDRMGVAIRNRKGDLELLTGNQIGSLIAAYRVRKLIDLGILTSSNVARAAIIKTLVTTDLQKAIAAKHGLRCVETLTGFKYIGEKLGNYEALLPAAARAKYRQLSEGETRDLRLKHSTYYVAGGEESYGYSAHDFVRDKDANASVVLFAEVCAYAKSRGMTVDAYLDEIYAEYGFYLEKNGTLTFEGADGATKIAKLATSYAKQPPKVVDGTKVIGARDFKAQTFKDVEGDTLPKESMVIFDLADGRRVAVRPSGTEPKIKFYMFARKDPKGAKFSATELAKTKKETAAALEGLWSWIQVDVKARL